MRLPTLPTLAGLLTAAFLAAPWQKTAADPLVVASIASGPTSPAVVPAPAPKLEPAPTPQAEPAPAPLPEPMITAKLVYGSRELTVALPADGQVDAETAHALADFFRDPRNGRKRTMNPGVLAFLADLARHYPGKTIEVVSGVRTPPNGAPHSKHFIGRAIDLRVQGVKTAEVRDWLWREHHGIGIGFYTHKNFIHMDFRPNENDCAWSGRREGGKNQYHPRWAAKARAEAHGPAQASR